MFGFLNNWHRREPKRVTLPVLDLRQSLFNGICPDCQFNEFFMGPQGGGSQNIKCANPKCGSEFCVGPFEDGRWLGEPMIAERKGKVN